jgi:hypothetical protein
MSTIEALTGERRRHRIHILIALVVGAAAVLIGQAVYSAVLPGFHGVYYHKTYMQGYEVGREAEERGAGLSGGHCAVLGSLMTPQGKGYERGCNAGVSGDKPDPVDEFYGD